MYPWCGIVAGAPHHSEWKITLDAPKSMNMHDTLSTMMGEPLYGYAPHLLQEPTERSIPSIPGGRGAKRQKVDNSSIPKRRPYTRLACFNCRDKHQKVCVRCEFISNPLYASPFSNVYPLSVWVWIHLRLAYDVTTNVLIPSPLLPTFLTYFA